ncbi:MAG: hypothetical protein ACI4BD_04455 [Paludibacteraceae bacterium]
MRKLFIFTLLLCGSMALFAAETTSSDEKTEKKESKWNQFARKHAHFTLFYNTSTFEGKDFVHMSRYGVGLEFTTKAYIGVVIRESMDFGLQDGFQAAQLNPNYTGEKCWYLTTDVGPSLNFFVADWIGISVPFLWTFRYGGNAQDFYLLEENKIFGQTLQFAMGYTMTPSLNFYLKKVMLSVGVNLEIVPKSEKKIANCGLHFGLGLGK